MGVLKSFMMGAEKMLPHKENNVFALRGVARCCCSLGAMNTQCSCLPRVGEDIGHWDQQVPGPPNHVALGESLPFFLSVPSGLLLLWAQVLAWRVV